MSAKDTRNAMIETVEKNEAFNYAYTPSDKLGTRYVFDDKVCLGLTEAYAYILSLTTENPKEED